MDHLNKEEKMICLVMCVFYFTCISPQVNTFTVSIFYTPQDGGKGRYKTSRRGGGYIVKYPNERLGSDWLSSSALKCSSEKIIAKTTQINLIVNKYL